MPDQKDKTPTKLSDEILDAAAGGAVSTPPTRGFFALPEVEDEVLVGFASADLTRPVILGAVPNPNTKPPE
ncbi:MAG: phage baseplate assembly protein V [Pseudomonadota bacterium]